MNKARLNYWVDAITGVAFAMSAASGLVFLLPSSASGTSLTILGISYQSWSLLHTWSSLAMIAGAATHLALHWQWVVGMTRKMVSVDAGRQAQLPAGAGTSMTRRRALQLGGVAVASCATWIGFRTLTGASGSAATEASSTSSSAAQASGTTPQSSTTTAPSSGTSAQSSSATAQSSDATGQSDTVAGQSTSQQTCSSCPKGVTYDAYPGRCHQYRDTDGDGYCDYSIPIACSGTGSATGSRTLGQTF